MSAVTLYPTPAGNEDCIRFRTLAEESRFGDLTQLCSERLLVARDPQSALRWHTNASIVKALQCHFGEAYGLLASASYVASLVEGTQRAMYENEFGLVLVEYNRPLLGLEKFDLSIEHHTGNQLAQGQVWNNKAAAHDVLGESSKALRCVASAVELVEPTGDRFSLAEIEDTGRRILKKLGGVEWKS